MSHKTESNITYQNVLINLRKFIELSLHKDETSWDEWISSTTKNITTRCWEQKQCDAVDCPAYKNECGRCWLIAGTMCDDNVQGRFAIKYASCTECEVFQNAVFKDPVSELQEHILILIHSLRSRQHELKEALDKVKLLSGFLPICASCKKIRDDKGYWNQIEIYIRDHSEAEFSHSVCPECAKKLYPDFT